MPNWMVGDLKVRGKRENVRRFILEGLEPVEFCPSDDDPEFKAEIVSDNEEFMHIKTDKYCFYIKNTRRHFIDSKVIDVYYYSSINDEVVVVLPDFKAAWYIEADQLAEISKKYKVDFKILGFECGTEADKDVEIIKGEIIKDEWIKFDDYYWECIRPHIGG